MSKSLNLTGNIKIIEDSVEVLADAISISETYSEITLQRIEISASQSDLSISFGGVGSDSPLIILKPTYNSEDSPSRYLTVKINGGSEAIPIGQLGVFGGYGSNGIDSLTVTNPDSSNTVNLKVYICK